MNSANGQPGMKWRKIFPPFWTPTDFSQRNRRQINIPEIWQYIQRGGKKGHFVIRGNMGNPCNAEFVQIDAAEFRAGCESECY